MLHTSVYVPPALLRSGEPTGEDRERTLVAVLLNPPATTAGTRSRNAVARAANVLGYDCAVMANLCTVATPSVVELNRQGRHGWDLARDQMEATLDGADAMLAGWGVAGLSGDAGRWMRAQVAWLSDRALERGISKIWMVGGEPRHPSRWHQYVSDKYGRTAGGTFEERIAQVLVAVPVVVSTMELSGNSPFVRPLH